MLSDSVPGSVMTSIQEKWLKVQQVRAAVKMEEYSFGLLLLWEICLFTFSCPELKLIASVTCLILFVSATLVNVCNILTWVVPDSDLQLSYPVG